MQPLIINTNPEKIRNHFEQAISGVWQLKVHGGVPEEVYWEMYNRLMNDLIEFDELRDRGLVQEAPYTPSKHTTEIPF